MVGIRVWRAGVCRASAGEGDEAARAERDLLQAVRTGDRVALERLLAPYERPLYALCRGILGHAEDAEDAVQETFLRALRSLPGFRGDAALRTWLFRIAANVCLEWKRSPTHLAGSRSADLQDEERLSASADAVSPEAIVLRKLRVMEALNALLPRHRAILLLKELEGWSVAEIAAALRWNEKRVQNELSRARRALADWRRRDASEGDEP